MTDMNEKKEESVNLDINFDSISEINIRNTSFYSQNEHLGNETRTGGEFMKSITENRQDLESVRMLPYYIEKVSQNIKFIDNIINKQNQINSSKSNSRDRVTNNTSLSNTHDPALSNIQTLVKNTVESVNEMVSNSSNLSHHIAKKSQSHNSNNSSNNLSNNGKNQLSQSCNIINNPYNNQASSMNFAVIEERDEDLFSRNSKMLNESANNKQKSNLNKANLIGVTKKLVFGLSENSNQTLRHISNHKKSLTNEFTSNNKIKLNDKSNLNKQQNRPALKKGNTIFSTVNTSNRKTINTETPKKTKINQSTKTTPNTSIFFQKTKTSSTNSNNFQGEYGFQKKTPSLTLPSSFPSTKSKKQLNGIVEKFRDKPLNSKKSLGNLGLDLKSNKVIKKTTIIKESEKCICKCHNSKQKTSTNNHLKNEKNYNLKNCSYNDKNSISVNKIHKINDINELNVKNGVELFYIFNEINSLNSINDKKKQYNINTNILGPNATQTPILYQNNLRQMQVDLLRLMRNFLENNEEIIFKNSVSTSENNNNSSISNLSFDKRRSEFNKRRDEKKTERIILIQRKWREYKIKKILYPLMNLDITHEKLEQFSFLSCNRSEVIKLCKLHLYSSLFKISDNFKIILSLLNKASEMWFQMMKKKSIYTTTENLIKDILTMSNVYYSNHISVSNFQTEISKIITNDLKINTNLQIKEDECRGYENKTNDNMNMIGTKGIKLTRNSLFGSKTEFSSFI